MVRIEPRRSAIMEATDGRRRRPPIHSNADPNYVAARWARQGAPIGKGAFGTVWRVVWEGGSGPKEAALKCVDVPALCAGANSAQVKQDILRELDLSARLSHLPGITTMLEAFVEPNGATLRPVCIRCKHLLDACALQPALRPCPARTPLLCTGLCTDPAPTLHSSGCRHRAPSHGDLQRSHAAVGARQARRSERAGDQGHHAAARRGRRAPARLLVDRSPLHTLWRAWRLWPLERTPVGLRKSACGASIGRVLSHRHARLTVHRDLKPENVMFKSELPDDWREAGALRGGTVEIIDFGVARSLRENKRAEAAPAAAPAAAAAAAAARAGALSQLLVGTTSESAAHDGGIQLDPFVTPENSVPP